MNHDLKAKLLTICRAGVLKELGEETVPEPYIPFIPKNWNRCLVLAEAQNHSKKNDAYLSWLEGLDSKGKMLRLYRRGKKLGCQPWDDGSLKFAVAYISKVKVAATRSSMPVMLSAWLESIVIQVL
jgi:hypothetical protein